MQRLSRSIISHRAAFAQVVSTNSLYAPVGAGWSAVAQRRHKSTDALTGELVSACDELLAAGKRINWVFLGAPGVGKGTYASRISKLMKIPHISAGDLVRDEIKRGTELGARMSEITSKGQLLPDAMILDILKGRVEKGIEEGERGFLLDGFPRTEAQAEELRKFTEVQQVMNLGLREDILVEKCCARRVCKECGKNFNICLLYTSPSPRD